MVHSSVNIRRFAAHDVQQVLDLNNANVPELNELDAAEVARLAELAEADAAAGEERNDETDGGWSDLLGRVVLTTPAAP